MGGGASPQGRPQVWFQSFRVQTSTLQSDLRTHDSARDAPAPRSGRSWAKPHVPRRALGQRKEAYAAVYRKGGRDTLLQETTTLGSTSWTEEMRSHVQHAVIWVKKQITCVNPWKFSAAGSFRKEGIRLIRKADPFRVFRIEGI